MFQLFLKVYLKKGFVLNIDKPIVNSDNSVESDDDIEEADDSGEITHLVLKGETLSSVARQYNMKLAQIKELNPRIGDGLSIGHKLIIKKGKVTSVIVEEDIVEDLNTEDTEDTEDIEDIKIKLKTDNKKQIIKKPTIKKQTKIKKID